jgi:hypothetical protein
LSFRIVDQDADRHSDAHGLINVALIVSRAGPPQEPELLRQLCPIIQEVIVACRLCNLPIEHTGTRLSFRKPVLRA